ncbi:Rieske 2Fe-2S domain-containing protein [Rhizorhabdus dicambivorans]|uniref:(2Fe-2S)-binding protein n=1 Tax=Rhizorhabdus dicambivorans TaxID=1850238 RepID=A0A2A4FXZ1_9SPHN|nr:Rieske 2Fe-2S domain-containing protein [Rhizorhabdus dicambivorans]ATE64139.1 (2Fe-2S)-binding protein [Rhizorhabdus dicambivorans]PCE42590.1 (2Fe-2S)-binding protein [Rhizorhabdus dicambivorans]
MLSQQENERMCRVGPETPMGVAMRRYWLPLLQSSELPEDAKDPTFVELLGEQLVAFRLKDGTIGVLADACCHRGASLSIGRLESCGVRCLYHGWLFAPDGKVLETPNVADPRFRDRIKARAYPVREAGGLIWTYLGDRDRMPEFPDFPWLDSTDETRVSACAYINCNYVQVMEGLVDSSHLSVLHSSALAKTNGIDDFNFATVNNHMQFDTAPRIEAEDTNFGFQYAAIRNVGGKVETRVTAFVAPIFILNPNADLFFAVVPVNDVKTAFYNIWWDGTTRFGEEPMRSRQLGFVGLDDVTMRANGMTRDTIDTPAAPSRANGFQQDRTLIHQGHFTGLPSFTQEDAVMSVSSGPLRDRRHENLSTADRAIGHLYRTLLRCASAVEEGREPLGWNQPVGQIRGTNAQLEESADWRELVPANRAEAAA